MVVGGGGYYYNDSKENEFRKQYLYKLEVQNI